MMHGHEKSDPAIVAEKPANKAKKSTAVEALNAIKATTCLIDGEAVTCSEAGLADFDGLRNRRGDVHLCALDLVELDGRDLRLEPLTTRRRLLARLIRKPRWELVLNALFEQDGPLVFEHACLLGCEGIVSKRKDSPYRSGRSRHWVKSKNPTAPAVKREAEEDWEKRNGDKLSLPFHLPHRCMGCRRRERHRTSGRGRGPSSCEGNILGRMSALAGNTNHLAPGHTSNRRQSPNSP